MMEKQKKEQDSRKVQEQKFEQDPVTAQKSEEKTKKDPKAAQDRKQKLKQEKKAAQKKKAEQKEKAERDPRIMAILKSVIMLALGAALAWALWTRFTGVMTRDPSDITDDAKEDQNEVDTLVSMNLDNAYPGTPNDTVNLYARIMKALYNEDYTAEQEEQLLTRQYVILDKELQDNQGSLEEYVASMEKDVKAKKDASITIANYFMEDSSDIEYYEIDGITYASVTCQIVMRSGSKAETYDYDFTLRKNTDGEKNWHILGWTVSQEDEATGSVVDQICNLDLDTNYPSSAYDVVELFAKITMALYNEDYTDDQMKIMGEKRAALYDEELLANQTDLASQIASEVSSKKAAGIGVANYIVDDADTFVYSIVGGEKCASGNCMFSMRSSQSRQIMTYAFVLRKDDQDRWKILGWETTGDEDTSK